LQPCVQLCKIVEGGHRAVNRFSVRREDHVIRIFSIGERHGSLDLNAYYKNTQQGKAGF